MSIKQEPDTVREDLTDLDRESVMEIDNGEDFPWVKTEHSFEEENSAFPSFHGRTENFVKEECNSDFELDSESDVEIDFEDYEEEENGSDDDNWSAHEPQSQPPGQWASNAAEIKLEEFQSQSGPRHMLTTSACPLDFFFLMFPLALIQMFVEETNRYAQQCISAAATVTPNDWYDTTVEEMRAFLAIQIMFGIRQLPHLWCYWSQDRRFADSWVSSVMTIRRFKSLNKYFHCRDNTGQPQRDENGFDPLYKVRPLIEVTQATFQQLFQANRELSVDKCTLGFKGRSLFKQHMPVKPTKRGVEIWTLCDAVLGYCLGYDVYTGKSSRRNARKPWGQNIVEVLCEPHYGKGHHIYLNQFLTSVDVAKHLVDNSTYMCGTIMTNSRGLPPAIKQKLKMKGELLQEQQGNLVATSYHNKGTITLLSTNQNMGIAEDGRPHQLIDYNKFMGGVNKFYQELSYFPVGRPGKKWWRYIVWHLINASIYNAYVVWSKSPRSYNVGKKYDHLMFRADVAEALCNGFTSRKLPTRRATKQDTIAPESINHHVIVRISTRKKQCVQCSMDSRKTRKGYAKETAWKCEFCDVALCRKVCFGKYHEMGLSVNRHS